MERGLGLAHVVGTIHPDRRCTRNPKSARWSGHSEEYPRNLRSRTGDFSAESKSGTCVCIRPSNIVEYLELDACEVEGNPLVSLSRDFTNAIGESSPRSY